MVDDTLINRKKPLDEQKKLSFCLELSPTESRRADNFFSSYFSDGSILCYHFGDRSTTESTVFYFILFCFLYRALELL